MNNKIKQLKNHPGFIKYFKNTSWLFAEKILRMVVGLFVGIWVARYLGPEQFGLFSYAQSFVGLFIAISTLGLDGIIVREIVKNEHLKNKLIATAFWLKLIGAIALLLILGLAIQFTSNDYYTNVLVFIIASATIFQSFNVIDFYFQANVLSRYVVYANIISLFISSIIKIVLILNNGSLLAFTWVVVFDSFVLSLGFIYFYLKNNATFTLRDLTFNKKMAKDLLKDSWPLILSSMVVSLYMRIDQVMIKEMLSTEAVGFYAAAARISEAWYFIPTVIASSFFPAIINAKKQSENLYYSRLQKLYNLMAWTALIIAIPMLFLSDYIINILYGEEYNQAGQVLMIHIWTGVFISLSVASGKWYVNENLTHLTLFRNLSGVITNVVLNYFLIPLYGIVGAAIGTLISYCMAAYVFDFFNKKTRHVFYQKTKAIFFYDIFKFLKGNKNEKNNNI